MASPLSKNPTILRGNVNVSPRDFASTRFGSQRGYVRGVDDEALIRNAINGIALEGGGSVNIPPGTYTIGSSFNLSSSIDPPTDNITISGVRGATKIELTTASQSVFGVSNGGDKVVIRDLWLDGGGLSSVTGIGIEGTHSEVQILDCFIENFDEGIFIGGGSRILIRGCIIQDCVDGLEINVQSLDTLRDVQVLGNVFRSNSGNGITISSSGTFERALFVGNISNGNTTSDYTDSTGVPTLSGNIGF